MKWSEWKPHYEEIKEKFRKTNLQINFSEDRTAALILQKIMKENQNQKKLSKISNQIYNQEVIIFGAGPSLEKHLKEFDPKYTGKKTIISVDGATEAFKQSEIKCKPDLIVTDLDGNIESIKKFSNEGSDLIIHAHGNNINKIRKHVPQFSEVMGTTQIKPLPLIRNFGGFTDGDRAVFLSEELGAKKAVLGGMDFGKKIGEYSKPALKEPKKASKIKQMKLKIAKYLIQMIKKRGKMKNIKYLNE